MSKPKFSQPKLRRIPLCDLLPRPGHPYSLPARERAALVEHVRSGGLYPPLIVRPVSQPAGKFEILDGHQRAAILGELGCVSARCEVWSVDDWQAEIYAASLNGLHGRANAIRRGRCLKSLIGRLGARRVGKLLALTPAAIRQQLTALQPPRKLTGPETSKLNLRPVVFHLPPDDAELLAATLRSSRTGSKRQSELLMDVIRAAGPVQSNGG